MSAEHKEVSQAPNVDTGDRFESVASNEQKTLLLPQIDLPNGDHLPEPTS
jgi:hypothetical protein